MMLYEAYFLESKNQSMNDFFNNSQLYKYIKDWGKLKKDIGFLAFDEITKEINGAVWLSLFEKENLDDNIYPDVIISVLPECKGHNIELELMNVLLDLIKGQFETIILKLH